MEDKDYVMATFYLRDYYNYRFGMDFNNTNQMCVVADILKQYNLKASNLIIAIKSFYTRLTKSPTAVAMTKPFNNTAVIIIPEEMLNDKLHFASLVVHEMVHYNQLLTNKDSEGDLELEAYKAQYDFLIKYLDKPTVLRMINHSI